MEFYEKLNFVMQLTNTTNQNLADAIGMPPSTISLYRNGKRGLPRKDENLRKLTKFLSRKVETTYQLNALSDAIGTLSLSVSGDSASIYTNLYNWFKITGVTSTAQKVKPLIDAFSVPVEQPRTEGRIIPISPTDQFEKDKTVIYLNDEGRKKAIRKMYKYILQLTTPGVLYQQIDEDSSWFFRDPIFTNDVVQYTKQLEEKGWKTIFLLPPTSAASYYELLSMSISRFQRGLSVPYFYPRMRDELYRGICFCVAGEIALLSHGVNSSEDNSLTILSTEADILKSAELSFRRLLKSYRPAINEISLDVFHNLLTEHLSIVPGAHLHRTPSLSVETIPEEVIRQIDTNEFNDFRPLYDVIAKRAQTRITHSPYYDICGLPSADEVCSGKVPICYSVNPNGGSIYYTSELFVLHLENILQIMDAQPNYHFIPVPYTREVAWSLALNASYFGLILQFTDSKAYVIEDQSLRSVFCEHLQEHVDQAKISDTERAHTKERIRRLIRELKSK